VCLREGIETNFSGSRHSGLDPIDAGIKAGEEALAHRRHAFGEQITHHVISITHHTKA
jgi:hypothetical protein